MVAARSLPKFNCVILFVIHACMRMDNKNKSSNSLEVGTQYGHVVCLQMERTDREREREREEEGGIGIHIVVNTGNAHEKFDQLSGSKQRKQCQIGA